MPHILIVEDEAAIADTLVYALQADGHSTEWVTLGGAALDQSASARPTWSSSISACLISVASKPAASCAASAKYR